METVVYYTFYLTHVTSRSHIYAFKHINENRNFWNNSAAIWENSHYQILGEILQKYLRTILNLVWLKTFISFSKDKVPNIILEESLPSLSEK